MTDDLMVVEFHLHTFDGKQYLAKEDAEHMRALIENGSRIDAELRAEIERLRAELHEAHIYAGQLAVSLRRKHFSELPPFELQPDLYGRLTQIDNMTCGMARSALGEKE